MNRSTDAKADRSRHQAAACMIAALVLMAAIAILGGPRAEAAPNSSVATVTTGTSACEGSTGLELSRPTSGPVAAVGLFIDGR